MNNFAFLYGPMGVGKSKNLIECYESITEPDTQVSVLKPSIDTRTKSTIKSRTGQSIGCLSIPKDEDIFTLIKMVTNDSVLTHVVLIDEAQFLTKEQVEELFQLSLEQKYVIICYGLKTDYKMELFEGSKALFELADISFPLGSLKCECGNKATINMRLVNYDGQILIGKDDIYKAVCKQCYIKKKEAMKDNV